MSIVTHNGKYHLDELVGVGILHTLYPNLKIIRTRDQEPIKNASYVVDVGFVYSHERKRYDHHQNGCNEVYNNMFQTPMSSAGMVFKHYGSEYIEKITDKKSNNDLNEIIYKKIIEHIDGIDNGIYPHEKGVFPKFKSVSLHDIVTNSSSFEEAMELIMKIIELLIKGQVKYYFQLENDMNILQNSQIIDNQIIVITEECEGFTELIHKFRKKTRKDIVYAVYIGNEERNTWSARAIQKTGFETIKPFPPEHYIKEHCSNIEFYHKKRFLVSCTNKESAIEVCKISLNYK